MARLQKVIEALRNELQQYGEIIALLDRQQELVLLCATEALNLSIAAIHAQGARIRKARVNRQSSQARLARDLGQPENSTFGHLIPLLPAPYRPLVTALVQENNELLIRVRQRAQQNQLLLRRSLDVMQHFINSLAVQEPTAPPAPDQALAPLEPASQLYEEIA